MATYFHFIRVSQNRKLGRIPATSSSKNTCPKTCPFARDNGGGCYGDGGPIAIHWAALSRGDRGGSFGELCQQVRRLPAGQLWRHNTVGDLGDPNTAAGRDQLQQLTAANRGRRGFTYTHHQRGAAAVQAMRAATANGFTVNASCHGEQEADAAVAHGLRAVMVAPKAEQRIAWDTAGGNRAVLCPATRRSDVTCETCGLCNARPSNVIVVFPAHGSAWRKAEAALS